VIHKTMLALAALVLAIGQPVRAQDSLDSLARDVDRLESLRAVKDIQRHYAQYGQYGLWNEMAALFADSATLKWGEASVSGKAAIKAWLAKRGGGQAGLPTGGLNTELIDQPLVNLSADGKTAKARWMSIAFKGDGKGRAWFEGGIYENDYVRVGKAWKIAAVHYFPEYEGPYAEGWSNVGNKDLPVFPFHFTIDETGVPIPPAQGKAPAGGTSLVALQKRIAVLNDEDAVRNVQNAYGYYVDRRMWDDVADLFATDAAVELNGKVYRGKAGVRQAMETMGPQGLAHGVLNEHPIFDAIVRIRPGGGEAESRGIELALLGQADGQGGGTAGWEINVFRNRFVKEGGLWKLKELRITPMMKADYASGWSMGALAGLKHPLLPAFLGVNPGSGKAVATTGYTLAAAKALTGATAPGAASATSDLADAHRRYQRSLAYDGTENVSSAYGFYIDDFQWTEMAGIFSLKGNKQSPFAGYYLGRDRIMGAVNASWGPAPKLRGTISFHWRTQPVIHVSQDGRSTNLRTRLFQPRTGKNAAGTPSNFYMGGFHGGMYPNDQAVLEDGIWRLWSLTIDEHYFYMPNWKAGWSGAKDPPAGQKTPPSALLTKYPPDIPITELGRREEGFRGGTGTQVDWPGILPMWFHYRNPVSGRTPDKYWPDCVPCEMLPKASMKTHGYQMPPNGPEVDGVELK